MRGFRQLIARRVRALTPQQQARLLKLEKLRLLRIWRYRDEGSAMLSPARQHFVLARLEYALRKWDASVLHGKALKERRMGLAAVQHYGHRRLTRAFYRLFGMAERRGSCSASCAAYAAQHDTGYTWQQRVPCSSAPRPSSTARAPLSRAACSPTGSRAGLSGCRARLRFGRA